MIYRNGTNRSQSYYGPISVRDDRNVNLEISYDNFDTVNLDLARKRQYAQDLRNQMEENERKRREAAEKKKLQDLEDELRLKREQELIDQRQKEENKRYRPQIDLPIQKVEEPKRITKKTIIRNAPEEVNTKYVIKRNNYLNENTLNFLRAHELEMNDFNDKILEHLRLLNNDFENNINSLQNEIGMLNDLNEKNKRYKDLIFKEVNDIKDNLNNRKKNEGNDTRNIYKIIYQTDYKRGNSFEPKRKVEIRPYVTKEGQDGENRFYIDDERKSDGLRLSPYVNLSHVISYDEPKWKSDDSEVYFYH